jgi:hypothetical protein
MARQGIGLAIMAQRITRQRADHGKQQRRVAAPERRIGIGHPLLPGPIGQRPQLRAVRIDRRSQGFGGDGDKIGLGHARRVWPERALFASAA